MQQPTDCLGMQVDSWVLFSQSAFELVIEILRK